MIPPIRRWPVPVECAALPPPARCRTSGPGGPAPTPRTHTRRTPALPHHRTALGRPRDSSGEKDSVIRRGRAGASGRAAAGFASTSLNPRARLLEVRARGLSDVLVGRGVRRPDVETCTSHSRCAFCSRERRLELHFRVRSAPLGVRGAPTAVAVRPVAPLSGTAAAQVVQIRCKVPDRAEAHEENR